MKLGGIKLKPDEIKAAFSGPDGERFPPILSTQEVATLLRRTVKTIDDWVSKKHLDGTFRKRGKHRFFWRDRVIDKLFNGGEWTDGTAKRASRHLRDDQTVEEGQERDMDS
jgi:hypothetical protein